MKKICFILGNYKGNGGIARVVSIISNELCKDASVTLLSYCPEEEESDYLYDNSISNYLLFNSSMSMMKALLMNRAVSKVRNFLVSNDIDIVIVCGTLFFPLGIIASKGIKTRCFCWDHTNPATVEDHRFQMFSRKLAVKFSDNIIVLTKSAENYYKNRLNASGSKVVQIYNPIGNGVRNSKKYNIFSKKILSVGRLSYPKNFQLLIRIAARILPFYPEWTWEICGEGEDRQELEHLIKKYKLENKVILRGQVNRIYSEYKNYAFIVMTSRYEGFPMSLIEAESNRLPVISFNIETGPNEIITDGENGYLIRKDDTTQMISKIINLIENDELRKKMAENAFYKSKDFNIESIMKQWRKLCM